MRVLVSRLVRLGMVLMCAVALAGCNLFPSQEATPESVGMNPQSRDRAAPRLGPNVNRFVWQATLDTVGFMRVRATDPARGVIATDWYGPPEAPYDRFRLVVNVFGPQLRSNAVRVAVYRLQWNGQQWVNSPASPATAANMENAILARARQLRLAGS